MGLFTKNTMSIDDMTDLVTFTVLVILADHAQSGGWADGSNRTNIINQRLEQSGHAASFWKLSKLAMLADGVARMLAANAEFMEDVAGTLETNEPAHMLIADMARKALFQTNLVQ